MPPYSAGRNELNLRVLPSALGCSKAIGMGGFEFVMQHPDPLTKAWWEELRRISTIPDREPWEEALLDITIALEPTIRKMRKKRALNHYDRFLLDLLVLLVAPNSPDPQRDRIEGLAKLMEHAPDC
jgi:hypothetical protein